MKISKRFIRNLFILIFVIIGLISIIKLKREVTLGILNLQSLQRDNDSLKSQNSVLNKAFIDFKRVNTTKAILINNKLNHAFKKIYRLERRENHLDSLFQGETTK